MVCWYKKFEFQSLTFKKRKGTKVAAFLSTADFKDVCCLYTSKLCSSITSSVFLYKQDPHVQISNFFFFPSSTEVVVTC